MLFFINFVFQFIYLFIFEVPAFIIFIIYAIQNLA